MTLDELLNNHVDPNIHSPTTIQSYKIVINVLRRDMGDIEIEDITISDFNRWKQMVLSRASGSTWNNYHRHIKALISSCIRSGLFEGDNPLAVVRPVKRPPTNNRHCDLSEVKRAIRTIEENPNSFHPSWFWVSAIKMLYYTGMRRRQLIGLCWQDIRNNQSALRLSSTHSKSSLEWDIPITEEVKEVLLSIRQATLDKSGEPSDCDQIFNITLFNHRYAGNRMNPDQVSGMFNRLRKYGVKLSAHKLRHTMATEICNQTDVNGMPFSLRTLQQQLGHSNITTTTMYLHPTIQAQEIMLSKLRQI